MPRVIKRLMRLYGLREEEVADAFGMTRQAINNRLTGRTPIPCSEEDGWALLLHVPKELLHGAPEHALRWAIEHPSDLLTRSTACFKATNVLTLADRPYRARRTTANMALQPKVA